LLQRDQVLQLRSFRNVWNCKTVPLVKLFCKHVSFLNCCV
jgi:hypothetical protein